MNFKFRAAIVLVAMGGLIGPQIVGDPTAIGHAYTFRWAYGFPAWFRLCEGRMLPSSLEERRYDTHDSHWSTRLLVPVQWQADEYAARNGPLIFSNPIVLESSRGALWCNLAYMAVIAAGTVYYACRMQSSKRLRRIALAVVIVLALWVALYYAMVVARRDGYIFFAVYRPLFLAANVLGIILTAISAALGVWTTRNRPIVVAIVLAWVCTAGISCNGHREPATATAKGNDEDSVAIVFKGHLPNDCVVRVHPAGGLSFVDDDEDVATIVRTILSGGYEGVHEFAIRVEKPANTSATDLFQVLMEFRQQLEAQLPDGSSAVIYVPGPHIDLDGNGL